ncbi:MAG TPA: hypothetical protein VFF68_06245 [Anaerolineaceae bacterium]|nr:hypothetical protein [Anaerolineaceae bacterium]
MSEALESNRDLQQIIESAQRLGIELDETDALQWLTAMSTAQGSVDIVVDVQSGVFGHRISMLDFSPQELAHFKHIGDLVEIETCPGVETALALSGSAAQSKIQTFPGDADFFQRVNIKAESWDQACSILAERMRDKVIKKHQGPTYQMIEVKLGSYPQDVIKNGQLLKAGSPIAWTPEEAKAGKIEGFLEDGTPVELRWEEVAIQPGWCKLDWVVADPVHHRLVNASNMLDATWEAPDGSITPLDGYLDPYFQEVYLEAEAIPLFTKLAKQVSADALEDYVSALEKEVRKYLTKDVNYGKAAKRMYNIFRLTGRYPEAAFLRELFDEPTTVLYQVWSLIRTIDDCFRPGSSITLDSLLGQLDRLVFTVIELLEGEKEVEIVRLLLRLRDILSREQDRDALSPQAEAAREEVMNVVNNFFHEKLVALPAIKTYMDSLVV